MSEDDLATLKTAQDQGGELIVRVGASDLNIPPLKGLFTVSDAAIE
jgi:hypothetical protein